MEVELSEAPECIDLVMPDAGRDGFAENGDTVNIVAYSFGDSVEVPLIDLCKEAISINPCEGTAEILVEWLRSIANEIERA